MSDRRDHKLGMDQGITRRDFLNGVAVPIGASLARPASVRGGRQAPEAEASNAMYPPTATRMRGSHDGSWEVAHQMRDQRGWDLSGAVDVGEQL